MKTLAPLGLVTMRLISIVRRTSAGGYTLVEPSSKEFEEDDDEHAKAIDAPPEGELMDTEAAIAIQGPSSDPDPSSTQVHAYFVRLEATVATILENQPWILECLDYIK